MLLAWRTLKKTRQKFSQFPRRRLALPNHKHVPPLRTKSSLVRLVSGHVRSEFRAPKILPRLWKVGFPATLMPMPEAPVNEDDLHMARQHEIGTSRKISAMESETKLERVDGSPYCQFRFRITLAHSSHQCGSFGRRQNVVGVRDARAHRGATNYEGTSTTSTSVGPARAGA